MSAKFCCTCIHWEKDVLARVGQSFGICDEPIVTSKVMQDTDKHLSEEEVLYTDPYFGCIYWRQNDGSLFGTDKIVKNL